MDDHGYPTPCRLGYEEHDGARYCHEHGDFLEAGAFYSGDSKCATAKGAINVMRNGRLENFDG